MPLPTLLAKLVADAESRIEIVPFWPPTEMITFLPAACLAAMSALNCATL